MRISGKDYTIDARKLMTLSVSDRSAMFRNETFREEILRALTPVQLAQLFPQEFRRGGYGGGGGGGGGGLGALASSLSGVSSGSTEGSSYVPPSVDSSTSIAPAAPANAPTNQPIENTGWFQRFMKKYSDKEQAEQKIKKETTEPLVPLPTGKLVPDNRGYVNGKELYKTLVQKFRLSRLNGFIPEDGARFGVTSGKPEEWARLSYALAMQESSLHYLPNGGARGGLYQFRNDDLRRYGVSADMSDPNGQVDAMIAQFEKYIPVSKSISGPGTGPGTYSGFKGGGAYFEPLRYPEQQLFKHYKSVDKTISQIDSIPQQVQRPQQAEQPQQVSSEKGTLLFLHGMQSRYAGKRPEQVEDEARRYATAKGLNFEAIKVSGNDKPSQRKAAIERINKGGITHILGFSAGGYNMGSVVDGISDDAKKQIQGVTIVGAPNTGKIPGIPTELVPDPRTGHMDGINFIAQQAEASAKRGTGAIYPEGQSLGPSGTAGEAPKQGLAAIQGFSEITPEKQTNRPAHYYGTLDIDGMKIPFGTGGLYGQKGLYPSAPAGSSEIGALNPHKVPGGVGYEVPGFNVKDPRAGWTRSGIVIHTNSSQSEMEKLYSHGCISISKKDWPRFQQAIAEFKKKHGSAYINLDPYGKVYSVTARPVYDAGGKIIEVQTVNETIQSKQKTGEIAPKFAFPDGLSSEVMAEVMKRSSEEQAAFVEALKEDPSRIQVANQMYVQSQNAQTAVQAVQENNTVEQLSKPYQPNEEFGKLDKAPTTSSLKSVDPMQKFPKGSQRFFHGSGTMEGVNPKLVEVLKEASKDLPPGYRVVTTSGRNSRTNTKNHPYGAAIDTQIIGPDGTVYPNSGFGPGHKLYETLAQSMDVRGQKMFPGTKYIWGGAWTNQGGDRMHMQIFDPEWKDNHPGAAVVAGMGYDWQKGIKPGLWAGKQAEKQFMSPDEVAAYRETIRKRYAEENVPPSIKQLTPEITELGPKESAGNVSAEPTAVPIQQSVPQFNVNADPLEGYNRGRVPTNAFDALNREERQALRVQFATNPDAARKFIDEYHKKTNLGILGKVTGFPEQIAEEIRRSEEYKSHFNQPQDVRQQIMTGNIEKLNEKMKQEAVKQELNVPEEATNVSKMSYGGARSDVDNIRINRSEATTPGSVRVDSNPDNKQIEVLPKHLADTSVREPISTSIQKNKSESFVDQQAPAPLENSAKMSMGNVPMFRPNFAGTENFGDSKQSGSQDRAIEAARFYKREKSAFVGIGTNNSNMS